MKAYIYQASVYCEDCSKRIISELSEMGISDTGDSDDYPQGPYPDGGGEADCPNHCDFCGLFLENSLTDDGVEYVREALSENPQGDVIKEWQAYYGEIVND